MDSGNPFPDDQSMRTSQKHDVDVHILNIYTRDVSDAEITRSADADAYANICA